MLRCEKMCIKITKYKDEYGRRVDNAVDIMIYSDRDGCVDITLWGVRMVVEETGSLIRQRYGQGLEGNYC